MVPDIATVNEIGLKQTFNHIVRQADVTGPADQAMGVERIG